MLSLLIRIFIKDSENARDKKVRTAYGSLCALYGMGLNLLLFAGKYFAGHISGSVAIIADAFNNLSDAFSSGITVLGFFMAGKKPDGEHPFGHGRIEYLTGLTLSMMIMLMGFELGRSSVEKILEPQPVESGLLPVLILVLSIIIKLYMSIYNRKIGRKIDSAAMLATSLDSLSDCISTLVVLLSVGISHFFEVNIDPWAGLMVAVFIIYAGFKAAKDTLSPLLGKAPDRDFVEDIKARVMKHPEILDVHDIIVHDYGPGRLVVSLHAEVDGYGDMFALHDAIDRAERELKADLGCDACIHMDPLEMEDSELSIHRAQVMELLQKSISDRINIHDFRMVPGPTHTKLIFDAAVPLDIKTDDAALAREIETLVHEEWDDHYAVVTVDRIY